MKLGFTAARNSDNSRCTRIYSSSERSNTMVEIFFWIDESEANTSFVKFGCCLMMEMVRIMVILMKTTCIPAYPPPMMSTWMLATASLLLAPDPILSFFSEAENAFYTISYALETKNIC